MPLSVTCEEIQGEECIDPIVVFLRSHSQRVCNVFYIREQSKDTYVFVRGVPLNSVQ